MYYVRKFQVCGYKPCDLNHCRDKCKELNNICKRLGTGGLEEYLIKRFGKVKSEERSKEYKHLIYDSIFPFSWLTDEFKKEFLFYNIKRGTGKFLFTERDIEHGDS